MRVVDFTFARDWIHAGVPYRSGDKASLSETAAKMLAEAGAGAVRQPVVDEKPNRWGREPKS